MDGEGQAVFLEYGFAMGLDGEDGWVPWEGRMGMGGAMGAAS